MRFAPLLLSLLLLFGCGAVDGASELGADMGEAGAALLGVCAAPTELKQPRERYAEDTCWRVEVPIGFGVTERGGDCSDAPRCLLTRSTAVDRQLLDWSAEGEDSPESWHEVRCDEVCSWPGLAFGAAKGHLD